MSYIRLRANIILQTFGLIGEGIKAEQRQNVPDTCRVADPLALVAFTVIIKSLYSA